MIDRIDEIRLTDDEKEQINNPRNNNINKQKTYLTRDRIVEVVIAIRYECLRIKVDFSLKNEKLIYKQDKIG